MRQRQTEGRQGGHSDRGDKRRQKGDKADAVTNKKGKGDKPDGSRTRCPAARRTLLTSIENCLVKKVKKSLWRQMN